MQTQALKRFWCPRRFSLISFFIRVDPRYPRLQTFFVSHEIRGPKI